MTDDQSSLFDADVTDPLMDLTLADSPLTRPARVGFLAGLLCTWALGPGVNPTAAEKQAALSIARSALAQTDHLTAPRESRG